MTKQYTVYVGHEVSDTPLMTAPMTTIGQMFKLHQTDVIRAEREIQATGRCIMFPHHRLFPLGSDAITVTDQVNISED